MFRILTMEVCVHLRITGQVQGVFFRRSAKIEADRLGIVGWVRNKQSLRSSASPAGLDDDGSVEVMAQGEKRNIDKFIAWCKKGPPFARVKDVEIQEQKGLEEFEDFSIV